MSRTKKEPSLIRGDVWSTTTLESAVKPMGFKSSLGMVTVKASRKKSDVENTASFLLESSLEEFPIPRSVFTVYLDQNNAQDFRNCLQWFDLNASECILLVHDLSYQSKLKVEKKLSTEEAFKKAREAAEHWIEEWVPEISQFNRCRFHFVLASEVQGLRRYNAYYETLIELVLFNDSFKKLVQAYSGSHLPFSLVPGTSLDQEEVVRNLAVIEELAVLACLSEMHKPLFVHTGNRLLEQLQDAPEYEAPNALQSMKLMELQKL